jgi:hypothetical protein
MKDMKNIPLYAAVVVLAAYGAFATLQERKLEKRIDLLEKKMATVYGGGAQWIAATR